jgi:signal transduction histidine kinase
MLRSKPMDEEHFSRALTVIERNMKVQAQIIEDLLDISSLRSGKLRLQSRIVEPGPIVAGSVNALRPTADSKSIQIVTNIEPSAGPSLWIIRISRSASL